MRRMTLVATLVAAAAANAGAQTITSGNATWRFNTSTTPGSADFRPEGGTTTDHMFQNWWWWRADGIAGAPTRETAFAWNTAGNNGAVGPADTLTISGSTQFFNWNLRYVITDLAQPNFAIVTATASITSTASTPYDINLFNYADFDVNGTAGSDSAQLTAPGTIRITDPSFAGAALFGAIGPTGYQVTSFATLRTLLDNATIDNLNNTGLPFGPGDFTGAWQWHQRILPGQTLLFTETLAIVPAPGAIALLGLGGTLALRRRRA